MSKKNTDEKGRWRNLVIAFRVTPEENEMITRNAAICGMSKQDYLIANMLHKEINVTGNPRVFKRLKTEMELILKELERIEKLSDMSDENLAYIKQVITMYITLIKDASR